MTNLQTRSSSILKIISSLLILLHYPTIVSCECTCEVEDSQHDKGEALKYKLGSILSIFVAGAIGLGVILATGFIHILPDAFDSLTSPCLAQNPWGAFPFTGFVAMMAAIGTLMVDSFATGVYKRMHFNRSKPVNTTDEEKAAEEHEGHVHVHTHATHGHAHGSASPEEDLALSELIRRRIVSQVLELGIVVHSVIIGISLGTSASPKTIKPLMAALCFHQFFEGMGLGGCITLHFSPVTTPAGIAVGIGISNIYNENSPTALIVEGIFNAASAGILIYMALVDLLAADFMSPRMQSSLGRIQLGANVSLLLGAGCMSFLAKWA
ncbi:hypothetical protein OIU84_019563 [Salix udensis]|uniref:Uncharacterized protein n=1 Tax=Salix udensis TaxID=889485 RepID=A0AAD6PJK2_9ROSI|nr:hypothetical protein OIU84_019563 [Salix udensis]